MCLAIAAILLPVAGCGAVETDPAATVDSGTTGEWMRLPAAPLSARHQATGAWVADRFVVLGGLSSTMCPANASCADSMQQALRDGAGFDPATRRWTRIAAAPVPLAWANPVVVGGELYVLTPDQGRADAPARFLSYDPGPNTWTTHPLPPSEGILVAVGSSVVAVSGSDEQGASKDAVFDPKQDVWKELPDDPLGPSFDRSAVPIDGGLLLAAKDLVPNPGAEGPALVRLARLDDDLSRWSTLPDSEIIGWEPTAAANRVVWPSLGSADGGEIGNWGRSYPEGGIFDPATGTWRALARPPWASALAGATAVVGDRMLVAGQLLDPVTGGWTRIPRLPGPERRAATVIGSADTLFVWGGGTSGSRSENLSTGYLLRPG